MAAALIRQRMAEVEVEVASAGLMGSGMSVPDVGIALMARRGLDLSAHRSRLLTPTMADEADLVLGMERRHVREVVAASPAQWPRTYTLKDFVRRAEEIGPAPSGAAGLDWWDALGRDRRREDLLGPSALARGPGDDEVRDPFRRPAAVWQEVIDELDDLAIRVTRLLASATHL
jgi:protein-tyrosine phosphatase